MTKQAPNTFKSSSLNVQSTDGFRRAGGRAGKAPGSLVLANVIIPVAAAIMECRRKDDVDGQVALHLAEKARSRRDDCFGPIESLWEAILVEICIILYTYDIIM